MACNNLTASHTWGQFLEDQCGLAVQGHSEGVLYKYDIKHKYWQGVLWGFAAAFTKGCSSKEREKRRVFAQRMRRGADVTLDHKVPRTFHLIANRPTDFKAEVEGGRGFHHTPSDRRVHSAADKALNWWWLPEEKMKIIKRCYSETQWQRHVSPSFRSLLLR